MFQDQESPIKSINYTEKKAIDLMIKFFDEKKIIKKFKHDYNKKELWLYCMLYMYGGIYNLYQDDNFPDLKIENTWYIKLDGEIYDDTLDNICIITPASNNVFLKIIIYIINNPVPSYLYEYTDLFINLINDKKEHNLILEII